MGKWVLELLAFSLTEDFKCWKVWLEKTQLTPQHLPPRHHWSHTTRERWSIDWVSKPTWNKAGQNTKGWKQKRYLINSRYWDAPRQSHIESIANGHGGRRLIRILWKRWRHIKPASYMISLRHRHISNQAHQCPLCSSPASVKHILVGCETSLSQVCYTLRSNQVLTCSAESLETKWTTMGIQGASLSYWHTFTHETVQNVSLKFSISPMNATLLLLF